MAAASIGSGWSCSRAVVLLCVPMIFALFFLGTSPEHAIVPDEVVVVDEAIPADDNVDEAIPADDNADTL